MIARIIKDDLEGYDTYEELNTGLEVGRRKYDGQWYLKTNNIIVKIDYRTYNRILKAHKKSEETNR